MKKQELNNFFSRPFQMDEWRRSVTDIFGTTEFYRIPREIPLPANQLAEKAYEIGRFETSEGYIVGLYHIQLKPNVRIERNKVSLRKLLRNVYKYEVDGALIVFEQDDKWRLSFVSEIRVIDEEGSARQQITEPKRYTYLLGKDEKVLTPVRRLFDLQQKRQNNPLSLHDILEAFSVEALNEEFYKMIAESFYRLIGGRVRRNRQPFDYGDGMLRLPVPKEGNELIYREFAVRLLGRIIFSWFLKVKKSDAGKPLLPERWLSTEAVKNNPGYYHNVLEKLFFQILNTHPDQRPDTLPENHKDIPFLNGGLFEAIPEDYYKFNRATGLSKYINTVQIPDEWFEHLFNDLEKYNFTIDENSTVDVEVSVDPEMLGRIFENLLAELDPDTGESARKATGSYYTPREIVDYMVEESLSQYIHNRTGIDTERILPLFKLEDNEDEEERKSFEGHEKEQILKALDEVKILDPACGSGAFPMGALHKIVTALQKLDPEAEWWKKRQIEKIPNPAFRRQVEEKLKNATVEYAQKLGVIRNNLYGVDIQPIATEISRLRTFLTLVVDENIDDSATNRGIEPLPNLEFNYVTANTLIKLNKEGNLFENFDEELKELKKLRDDYFLAYGKEKEKLRDRFKDLTNILFKKLVKNYREKQSLDPDSMVYQLSTWDPFSHKSTPWFDPEWMFGVPAFDIVLGNPPYRQIKKGILKKEDYPYSEGKDPGKQNLYKVFIERSVNLSKDPQGLISLIVQSSLLGDLSAKHTREFLLKKNRIVKIVEFPKNPPSKKGKVFKSVLQGTCIVIAERTLLPDYSFEISITNDLYSLKNLSFETIPTQLIFKLYPNTFYIPLVKKGEIPIILKISKRTRSFIHYVENIQQGDINLSTYKEYITNENTNIKLYRGRHIHRFYIDNDTNEFVRYFPKLEKKILYNKNKDFILSQEITGTTDKRRLHFCVLLNTPSNIVFGHSINKTLLKKQYNKYIKLFVLIINSKFLDWIFRKTSTNNNVMGYEIEQFPITENVFDKLFFDNYYDYMSFIYTTSYNLNAQFFENLLDFMVLELYFEEEFHAKDIHILSHIEKEIKPIEHLQSDKEKAAVIREVYQKLSNPDHEVNRQIRRMHEELPDIVGPILGEA